MAMCPDLSTIALKLRARAKPSIRKVILRLPQFIRTAKMAHVGYVLGLGIDGSIKHNLQDPSGKVYGFITSVTEQEGKLYLGSVAENALGILVLS